MPADEEIDGALKSALVAVDANVLLGLYRFPDEFSSALRDALEHMADRLFVPRQALSEFWRNRTSALADRARARAEVERQLESREHAVIDALNAWAKATTIDETDREHAVNLAKRQFDALRNIVSDSHQDDGETYPSPGLDPIVQALEALLEGRVGPCFTDEEFDEAIKEGKRRHALKQPPGFKEKASDKDHLPEGVAGDYLVWIQAVNEAEHRDLDLLILTSDEKEDWYWRSRDAIIGPRPELSLEFWKRSSRRLFLLTPVEFMRRFASLGGDVSEAVIVEAERQSTPMAPTPLDDEAPGWTREVVLQVLQILDVEAPIQAEVIRAAAYSGGMVEREVVYELGRYSPKRMLRGFTRPVRRVSRIFQESGELDVAAPDLLQPRYDHGVQANAFEIPAEVVAMLQEGDV